MKKADEIAKTVPAPTAEPLHMTRRAVIATSGIGAALAAGGGTVLA